MTISAFAEWIGLPREAAALAKAHALPAAQQAQKLALFEKDEPAFMAWLQAQAQPQPLALSLYLPYAAAQEKAFAGRGLSRQVYHDTMRDLALWYKECVRQTGAPGLVEWEWLAHSLKGRVLRLGRLQYQPGALEEALCVGAAFAAKMQASAVQTAQVVLAAGTPVLEVHIPADGPLQHAAVIESFAQAKAVYAKDGLSLLHCTSWLLSPTLRTLLPEGSNIARFQEFFSICGEKFSFRQAEERVFGAISDEVANYPEDTLLQKRLKQFLQQGGRVGMGVGVRRL